MIGVHHRDDRRGGRAHALDRGAGQPAPADALDAPHPRIGEADRADFIGGAVGAVVVDENRFPGDAGLRRIEPIDQGPQIFPFVQRRQDNGKLEHRIFLPQSLRRQNQPV
jgi:hypothetical protein